MCDMNKKNEIFNNTQELSGKMKKNEEQGQAAEDQKKDDLKYDFWLASLLYINSSKRI